MKEYEFNIKVKEIQSTINFCKDNGFEFVSKTKQNRVVFENKDNRSVISRITTTWQNDQKTIVWDFKNVNNKSKKLKESIESKELILTEKDVSIAKDMLKVANFELFADNLRTRYVYEKDNVKFEIDDYERPAMKVVAIEGDKQKVDEICIKLQNAISSKE